MNYRQNTSLKKSSTAQSGFTLIETFVAITILVVAVLGPMTMFSRAISDGAFAENQITAFYLAQEEIELVVNKRDSNEEEDVFWLSGLADEEPPTSIDQCTQDAPCTIEENNGNINVISCSNGCEVLNKNNGKYVYDNSEDPTMFRRELWFEKPYEDTDEVIVHSVVHWGRHTDRQTEIITSIFPLDTI